MSLDEFGSQEFLGTVFGEISFHINIIEQDMEGLTPEIFSQNRMARDALAMRLQGVGELIKRITGKNNDEFGLKKRFPDFPWDNFKGMRDWLAHNYSHVKIEYSWEAYSELLPEIKKIIETICLEYPNVKKSMEITENSLRYLEQSDIGSYRQNHNLDTGPK